MDGHEMQGYGTVSGDVAIYGPPQGHMGAGQYIPKPAGARPGQQVHHHIPLYRQIAALPAQAIAVLPGDYPDQILPQRPFRLERLILEDMLAHQASPLAVDAITIGADPQFMTNGSLPIETFAALSVGLQLTGQTATPGTQLTVSIQVLAGAPPAAPTVVTGGFFGAAILPSDVPGQHHVQAQGYYR